MIKATKPITKINRIRHDIDATGIYLGRLAVQIAVLLRGKNKTSYTPNADCGDTVFVSNVNKLKFSGNKINQKIYYRHSGYIGNLKETKLKDLFKNNTEKVLYKAVSGMLPDNRLKDNWLKRLKFVKND
ncbi:MAG: 50S ribosomal protein L13 [Berkelbacteria bacterium GW2011_GWA2_35_9]|uniref:Large ribosomal subunit protein uL13 n=1 Tax=Berkelbacteria bacterium GW2011_GWA2_35_9 TaxID=1618333 RepID=A0A0G0FP70_9BACT|nr:MAG: 50S ribosomal protein L13 [Berkelbacteria bacterium GW2011_GWA2_35_9]